MVKLNELPPGPIRDALERQLQPKAERKPIKAQDAYKSKWERWFAAEVMAPMLTAGEIVDWRYEAMTLKIGVGAKYTPDFMTKVPDGGRVFYEVKGRRHEAGIVRLKAAALIWPDFKFVFVTRGKDGGWSYTRVG